MTNGYAFFGDGQVVFFKTEDAEPQKHHAIQVWQTPFVSAEFVAPTGDESYLSKIGNRDIVRGMAECVEVLELLAREDLYADLYVDLVKTTSDLLDAYFWLDHEESAGLSTPLGEIKTAAEAAVGEYEKVTRIRRSGRAAGRRGHPRGPGPGQPQRHADLRQHPGLRRGAWRPYARSAARPSACARFATSPTRPTSTSSKRASRSRPPP